MLPSSTWLGRYSFKIKNGVRISMGVLNNYRGCGVKACISHCQCEGRGSNPPFSAMHFDIISFLLGGASFCVGAWLLYKFMNWLIEQWPG
jgi:hypothetical protein